MTVKKIDTTPVPKLTPKQAKFVQEMAKGKTQREAYIEAYDTKGHKATVDGNASRTANHQQVKQALETLWADDATKEIVANLRRLATKSTDEKIQVDATKVWLDRAVPKQESPTNLNVVQVIQGDRNAYDI